MNLKAESLQLGLRLTPRFAQLVRGPWIFYSFGLRSMESVLAAGRRAADLTRQLLAYSGKGRFRIEPVNVSEAVSEILELIHASIPERIRLELRLDPALPAVEADRSQIQQVAMNLIINASEAIPHAGHIVIATTRTQLAPAELKGMEGLQHLAPGDYVILQVDDNGEGFSFALGRSRSNASTCAWSGTTRAFG